MEFDCITCDDHVVVEGEMIVFQVFKNGSQYYACSDSCAEEARDNPGL